MPAELLLPWLDGAVATWRDSEQRNPHAVIVAGAAGVGKRILAAWMAGRFVAERHRVDAPLFPFREPAHADIAWLKPAEDKKRLSIEQIRQAVERIRLTSYEGRGKALVIEPADAMTANAANSLLKTLEEPPGDALIILVADSLSRIPATVLSRCQRIAIPLPASEQGRAWLQEVDPAADWAEAFRMVGRAPLAAVAAAQQERLEIGAEMSRQWRAIAGRKTDPLAVAQAWAKLDSGLVFGWIYRQIHALILSASGAAAGDLAAAGTDTAVQRIDTAKLFCYLDAVNRLRGQPAESLNLQLALENLLLDWSNGLARYPTNALEI